MDTSKNEKREATRLILDRYVSGGDSKMTFLKSLADDPHLRDKTFRVGVAILGEDVRSGSSKKTEK